MEEKLTYLGYVVIKKKDGTTFTKVSFFKVPSGEKSEGYEALTIFPSDAMIKKIVELKPMTEINAILLYSKGKDGKSYTNLVNFTVCK